MRRTSSGAPAAGRPSANQTVRQSLRNPVRALLVGLIRFYQVVVSPGIPGHCKYYPSCSQYALDAVREYGAMRGFVLAAWRVLRCNPLSYGGYDPVSRQKVFHPRVREGVALDATTPADGHAAVCAHRHLARG